MSTEIPSPIPFLDDALNTDVIIVTNLAHTPQHIAAVRQYRIVQVAWLKESRSVEHEALQFFIQDPADNSHRTYWLLADRVGRPRPSPNSSVTSLEDAVASGKQLVNLSSSVPAHDRITISATSTATDSDYQTISTLELPKDAQLSLSNILALLYSVSKSSELYHIFDKNCYWFARSVYKAIQLASPGSVETKSSSRRTGYLGRIPITPEVTSDSDVVQTIISAWKIKMGECNGLKTTEEKSAEDEAKGRLSEEARTAQEKCEREKAELKAQEAEQKVHDAEQRAKEAEQKVKEAGREAMEDRQKREDAERKAEILAERIRVLELKYNAF